MSDEKTPRTHTTFKSAEVLEDIAKVYEIQAEKLRASYETARNKAAGYRALAAVGRRMKSDAYPSNKPEGWEVTVLVEKLPKRGSGKSLIDAVRDLETRLPAETAAAEVTT